MTGGDYEFRIQTLELPEIRCEVLLGNRSHLDLELDHLFDDRDHVLQRRGPFVSRLGPRFELLDPSRRGLTFRYCQEVTVEELAFRRRRQVSVATLMGPPVARIMGPGGSRCLPSP